MPYKKSILYGMLFFGFFSSFFLFPMAWDMPDPVPEERPYMLSDEMGRQYMVTCIRRFDGYARILLRWPTQGGHYEQEGLLSDDPDELPDNDLIEQMYGPRGMYAYFLATASADFRSRSYEEGSHGDYTRERREDSNAWCRDQDDDSNLGDLEIVDYEERFFGPQPAEWYVHQHAEPPPPPPLPPKPVTEQLELVASDDHINIAIMQDLYGYRYRIEFTREKEKRPLSVVTASW